MLALAVTMLAPMESPGDRIKRARLRAKLTQLDLAKAANVSRAAVAQWESDETKHIRPENLFRIAPLLGCSAQWLATGEEAPEPSNTTPGPSLRPAVPLISWVQAGNWTECHDPYPPGVADEWVNPSTRVSACAFALSVRGDSMEPEFAEGATIIVDPAIEAGHGSFVIVRLDDAQEATFKQLVVDGGSRFLKPLNERYPIIPINGNATIVGVVVEQRKEYRR